MRGDDHGEAILDRQPPDNLQHLSDQFRIERGGGFVEQQDAWPGSEGAGDRHSLLLAAGQMAGQRIGAMRQTDPLQQFARPLVRGRRAASRAPTAAARPRFAARSDG